ncbi:MAG: glycoside hydrolase family 2 TIM barrel-domain containing protein [Opitutae bacterium]|nr:glycoside hydrolase family 2 TIM barrel-domain containing protein [Opitutae bacterium]
MNFVKSGNRCVWLMLSVLLTVVGVQAAGESRVRVNFSEDWQFHLGDVPSAEQVQLDDAPWRTLDVPHDWSIELPLDPKTPGGMSVGYLPGGIGWYRKHFTMPNDAKGKQVFIDFDGVYMNSKVWVNGHLLGFRPFGYVGFRYDLTPHLNFGGENVIAVQVNVKDGCSRWYPGAGIYRRVWLTTANPIHVAHWGQFVTTPEVSKERASVRLQTEVENKTGKTAAVTLKSVILGPQGKSVAKASSTEKIAAGEMLEFDQNFTVTNPMLWSPDTPDLYKVVSTVEISGKVTDQVTTTLGIRWFEFTIDKGLIFNGEKMDVKGVCLHQDFGPLGTAFNPRAMERRLEIMREMGCNAIRTSHNPRDPEFYALCDRMGFLVMDEVFDEWKIPKLSANQAYALYFDEWSERDLTSVIRRDRNHPSVVMWSIGNEINEQYKPHGGVMSARLAGIVKQHDTSRPITAGCNSPSHAQDNGFDKALDIFGLNYSYEVYDQLKGKRAMIGTENSTDWSARGSYSYFRPLRGDLQILGSKNDLELTSYGTFRERDADLTLRKMRASPWVAGQFTWTGFDYRGEVHPFKWPVISAYWGIVDMVGFPKDQYFLYQSDWSDKPMVHILPQHWNWPQYPNATFPVWVYSNCDEVELFQNNKSLGVKTIDREKTLRFEWGVKYTPGTLKAVGYKNGQQVCTSSISSTDAPAKIALVPDRTEIAADGSDLSYIEVCVTDELGRICPDADQNLIQFEVTGAGRIVGVSNGSSHSHDPSKGSKVHSFRGLCMLVVQSAKNAGPIHIKAISEGLKEMHVQLQALPADSPKLAKAAAERERLVREHNKKFSRHRLSVLSMKDGRPVGKPMDLKAIAEEQKELAAHAAAEFPTISLTPTVHFGASLKKLGVTAQPQGGTWAHLNNVLGRKDWLRALSILNPEIKEKYPNRRELDRLLNELRNMRYTLNLQPQFDLPEGKTLYYIFTTDGDKMHLAEGWYQQSGIGGWTHWWVPDNTEVFVLLADEGDASKNKIMAIHQSYLKELKVRSDKHSLGEFSDAQYHHECERLANQQHTDYIDLMSHY